MNEQRFNHGKSWTPADDERLKYLVNQGLKSREIGALMGRTFETIDWRWKVLKKRENIGVEIAGLAAETMPILPGDEVSKFTTAPTEMVERSFLFGLMRITRFKYGKR